MASAAVVLARRACSAHSFPASVSLPPELDLGLDLELNLPRRPENEAQPAIDEKLTRLATVLGQTSDRMRDPTMQTADNFNSDCMIFCGIQCVTGCGWM